MDINKIYQGDALSVLQTFSDNSIDMCMTSPPYYGLRDYSVEQIFGGNEDCVHEWGIQKGNRNIGRDDRYYGGNAGASVWAEKQKKPIDTNICLKCQAWKGQLGLEPQPEQYIQHMTEIFHEVKRVLKKTGTLWLVIGDTYGGSCQGGGDTGLSKERYRKELLTHRDKPQKKMMPKCLMMIPERLAWSMIQDGWILRNKNIWHKHNGMPSSVQDRFSNKYEFVYMFSQSQKYYFDLDAVREKTIWHGEQWGNAGKKFKDAKLISDHEFKDNPAGKNPGDVFEINTQPFTNWAYDFDKADGVDDCGKPYIVSEDCPLHGHHHGWRRKQTELYGEQPNLQLPRMSDIANYPELKPGGEPASTHSHDLDQKGYANSDEHIDGNNLENKTSVLNVGEIERFSRTKDIQKTPSSNLDYSSHNYFQPAIVHNKQSHKKDHVPLTNRPYNASDKTDGHIGDKQEQPFLIEIDGNNGKNKSVEGISLNGKEKNPLAEIPSRNVHKSYSNYTCTCQISQVSHFAVYPVKLCEKPIKAGCPKGGIVLDPFSGAGTTCYTAAKLGRDFIGIEIGKKYKAMSEDRIFGPLFKLSL